MPAVLSYYHSFRTQHGSAPAVLSLLPLFSDSEAVLYSRNSARGSVPITTLFGLSSSSVPASSVPITTLFGLSTALCPQFCPYYHSFRTLHSSVPAVLSLLPLYSDSASSLCPQFCPYYHSIRTQRSSVPAVLSESEPYLDSVKLFSFIHFLNQTILLNKRLFSWIFHSQVLFTFFKRDINGKFWINHHCYQNRSCQTHHFSYYFHNNHHHQ